MGINKQEHYLIIPGTEQRVFAGSVVMLYRLPNLKWILYYGFYNYNGRKQKGWYFSSIPSDTTMPAFTEDLVAMKVIDGGSHPCPPYPPIPPQPAPIPPVPPCPPGPYPPYPPTPPAPVPIPYTAEDKAQVDAAMITVDDLEARDKLGHEGLQNGKIVRVNDIDNEGTIEYYSWNAENSEWELASLGYRYMTRTEVMNAVGDDIVSIVWSDENGALVLTNNAGTEVSPVQLLGVAHDPIYIEQELTLRIPVYGHEDVVITIPRDQFVKAVRFEPEWEFETPQPHTAPAIVITVSDGITDTDIAGEASALVNVYTGKETATAKVIIESATGFVTADVKLSSIANNPLKVDNEGLWVDLSGVVAKQEITSGLLLVADGNGQFTYGGNGVELETSTAIADLTNPEKKVVTANLIADAISASISALQIVIEGRIQGIESRVSALEEKVDIGEGANDELLVTSNDGMTRSGYTIGGDTLDTESENTVATEQAVTKVVSWQLFNL